MTSPAPVLIVAGLGRCGTTAMMTALAAGGIPTAGEAPAFEPPETMPPVDPAWLAAQAGRAVKLLDPYRHNRDALRCPRVVLFMTREHREQAKSQAKMVEILMGAPRAGRREIRRLAAGLANDQWAATQAVGPIAQSIDFATLVRHPELIMRLVAQSLRPWWSLDEKAAAAAIVKRDPRCAPGLDMEMRLAEAAA